MAICIQQNLCGLTAMSDISSQPRLQKLTPSPSAGLWYNLATWTKFVVAENIVAMGQNRHQ